MVGFGLNACILSDAANQPPLILTTQGTLPQLKEDPLSSKLFVFLNKRADRVKMLYWDGSGLWILMKRLERGVFARPKPDDKTKVKIHLKPEALDMLLAGIDLKDGMQRAWYQSSD